MMDELQEKRFEEMMQFEVAEAERDYEEYRKTTAGVLEERGARYGAFKDFSEVSQSLKAVFLHGMASVGKDPTEQNRAVMEAVEMICHKLARVSTGDTMYDDNFVDIAGYAELAVKEIRNGHNRKSTKV